MGLVESRPLDLVTSRYKMSRVEGRLDFITCAPAMPRAAIVFGGVCVSVSVCKSKVNRV